MSRPKRWRVRVKRSIEDWIEITAHTVYEAEAEAAVRPGVLTVLRGMTMSGEKPVQGNILPVGVEDEDGN